MSVKHKAEALVVHCIDFRFQHMIEEDLEQKGLKDKFDRISWPGASKDHDTVIRAAKKSFELHVPDQALIYEHAAGCGGYKDDDSLESHRQSAQRLEKSLKEIKPNVQVRLLIATFDGIKDL